MKAMEYLDPGRKLTDERLCNFALTWIFDLGGVDLGKETCHHVARVTRGFRRGRY